VNFKHNFVFSPNVIVNSFYLPCNLYALGITFFYLVFDSLTVQFVVRLFCLSTSIFGEETADIRVVGKKL